jgi:hypothetical protein
MIKFHCEKCDKKIGVPEEYSGKLIKCPRCKQPARVPELELEPVEDEVADSIWSDDLLGTDDPSKSAPVSDLPPHAAAPVTPDSMTPAAPQMATPAKPAEPRCSKCSTVIPSGSEFCITCGQPVQTLTPTISASTKSRAVKTVAKMPLALVGGFIGASIGAFVWAAIVYYTHYEVGFVAWGIGVLAGLGVFAVVKEDTSPTYGLVAAAMALVGLFGGKLLSANWIIEAERSELKSSEEMREIVAMAIRDDDVMFDIACSYLEKQGEFDTEFADLVIAVHDVEIEYKSASEVTIPPDREEELTAAVERVKALVADWPMAQKRKIAADYFEQEAQKYIDEEYTYFERLKESLAFWDILWFCLALGSAYKLGAGITSNE